MVSTRARRSGATGPVWLTTHRRVPVANLLLVRPHPHSCHGERLSPVSISLQCGSSKFGVLRASLGCLSRRSKPREHLRPRTLPRTLLCLRMQYPIGPPWVRPLYPPGEILIYAETCGSHRIGQEPGRPGGVFGGIVSVGDAEVSGLISMEAHSA